MMESVHSFRQPKCTEPKRELVEWSQGPSICTWTGEVETAHPGHKEGWMDVDTHTHGHGVSCASVSQLSVWVLRS